MAMVKLNPHYKKLISSYLFPKIQSKVSEFKQRDAGKTFLNLGIGDVTKPLPPSIVAALVDASKELGSEPTMQGYGPSSGYGFLRELIAENDYKGLKITADEVFVSNGAKCDIANIQEILSQENSVAICDPTYPVYLDSNVMAGRTLDFTNGQYQKIIYLPCLEENNFFPDLPKKPCDIIYLCSPNNPTGIGFTYEELKKWVNYALENEALIIFDAAYEAFITSENVPHSIFEIDNAKKVAIEIKSYSKKCGFTNIRASYTIVPHDLIIEGQKLNEYWSRRQDTKFGGVPYPIQKAAAATYSPQGQLEIIQLIDEYKLQAKVLREGLIDLGFTVYGGVDAPYVWCKSQKSSWEFFDDLLENHQIITIPGEGFGHAGKGFVRFSAFAPLQIIKEALNRLSLCVTQ